MPIATILQPKCARCAVKLTLENAHVRADLSVCYCSKCLPQDWDKEQEIRFSKTAGTTFSAVEKVVAQKNENLLILRVLEKLSKNDLIDLLPAEQKNNRLLMMAVTKLPPSEIIKILLEIENQSIPAATPAANSVVIESTKSEIQPKLLESTIKVDLEPFEIPAPEETTAEKTATKEVQKTATEEIQKISEENITFTNKTIINDRILLRQVDPDDKNNRRFLTQCKFCGLEKVLNFRVIKMYGCRCIAQAELRERGFFQGQAFNDHAKLMSVAIAELLREELNKPGDTLETTVADWLKTVGTSEWTRIFRSPRLPDAKIASRAFGLLAKEVDAPAREKLFVQIIDEKKPRIFKITRLS